ncbi:MAG: CvpA family protein [Methylococcaceae bacterium]|nr:CvpA family protein [Methylococcaceae bacterium]
MPDFLSTSQWVWIDYAIAGIIAISAVMGLLRGFIKEAFALLTWIVAIWVGMQYSRDLSIILEKTITYPSARIAVAFAILFFATLILGGLINFLLSQLVEKTGLTGSDRLVGMGFGIVRGAVLVAVLVMLAGLTPLPEDPWWKQSSLIPPFQSLAVWLKDHIPSGLAGYIKYR